MNHILEHNEFKISQIAAPLESIHIRLFKEQTAVPCAYLAGSNTKIVLYGLLYQLASPYQWRRLESSPKQY